MQLLPSLATLFLVPVLAAQTPIPAPGTQRLAAVGHLWSRVKWTHPALAQGDAVWEKHLPR